MRLIHRENGELLCEEGNNPQHHALFRSFKIRPKSYRFPLSCGGVERTGVLWSNQPRGSYWELVL